MSDVRNGVGEEGKGINDKDVTKVTFVFTAVFSFGWWV